MQLVSNKKKKKKNIFFKIIIKKNYFPSKTSNIPKICEEITLCPTSYNIASKKSSCVMSFLFLLGLL